MPEVKVTRTIAAAGDYAAGDIISDDADNTEGTSIAFDPAIRYDADEGVVTHVIVTCSVDALVVPTDLDIFDSVPDASELDDNAAASIAVADRSRLAGTVSLPAFTDRGAISVAEANCYIPVKFLSGSKALRAIHRAFLAFTNESAGMTITYRLFVEPVH